MRAERTDILKFVYKSLVISGSIMLTNDTARYYGVGSATQFGKITRNIASTAIGYTVGKKAADASYDAIEAAVERYKEA